MTRHDRFGIDVQPRPENESALVRTRVRQRQTRVVSRLPVDIDDVHVEGPRAPPLGPHPDWTTLINPQGGLRYQIPPTGWRQENAAGGNVGQVQLRQGAYLTAYTCGTPARIYQRGQLGSGSAPKADPALLATSLARLAATSYYTPPGSTTSPTITVAGPEPVTRVLDDGTSVTGVQVEAIANQQGDPCLDSEGEVRVRVFARADRDAVLVVDADTEGGPASPPPATNDQLQAILDTAVPTRR